MSTSSVPTHRSPMFQRRLLKACDDHPDCPPLHKGRLVWIRDRLSTYGVKVTIESVRRWLAGEGRPKQEKCEALANVLGVNGTWLYMGEEAATPAGRKRTHQMSDNDDTPLLIKLRPGVVVTVSGIPLDFSATEARKIANIVLAHAEPATHEANV